MDINASILQSFHCIDCYLTYLFNNVSLYEFLFWIKSICYQSSGMVFKLFNFSCTKAKYRILRKLTDYQDLRLYLLKVYLDFISFCIFKKFLGLIFYKLFSVGIFKIIFDTCLNKPEYLNIIKFISFVVKTKVILKK